MRKKGCFRLVFSMKCSSGHLNTALTTLPKNSMEKNWKSFALNPTNFEKLRILWKTKFSDQNGQKRLSFVDVESSSYTRAETVSQKTRQFFTQNPKNLTKQYCTHDKFFYIKSTFDSKNAVLSKLPKTFQQMSEIFNKHPVFLSISKFFSQVRFFHKLFIWTPWMQLWQHCEKFVEKNWWGFAMNPSNHGDLQKLSKPKFLLKKWNSQFFHFRHVESSLYNCAGSSFAKTLRVCAKCQKNY